MISYGLRANTFGSYKVQILTAMVGNVDACTMYQQIYYYLSINYIPITTSNNGCINVKERGGGWRG